MRPVKTRLYLGLRLLESGFFKTRHNRLVFGSHFGSSMRIALILLKLIGSVTGSSGSLAAH
jgi:hypothetical protein